MKQYTVSDGHTGEHVLSGIFQNHLQAAYAYLRAFPWVVDACHKHGGGPLVYDSESKSDIYEVFVNDSDMLSIRPVDVTL